MRRNVSHWRLRACTFAAALLVFSASALAGPHWYELRTRDYRIISAVDRKHTLKIAQNIEVYQATVARAMSNVDTHPRVPVTLLLLPENLFRQYAGIWPKVGVAMSRPAWAYAIADAENWEAAAPVVFHELSHLLLHQNNRGTALPVWYDEGYADFLSTIEPSGHDATLGRVPVGRWLNLQALPWIPLPKLLSVSHTSPEYQAERLAQAFYAESWAIVHYVIFANPERGQQVERYRVLLSSGFSPEKAFAEAFPNDNGSFEKEIKAYASQRIFHYAKISDVGPSSVDGNRIREIPTLEGQNELASWMLRSQQYSDANLAFLGELARGAPPQSVATVQLAVAHILSKHVDLAQPLLAKACVAPIDSLQVAALCGEAYFAKTRVLLSEEPVAPTGVAESLTTARRFYLRALELEPDHLESLFGAAETFAGVGGDSALIRTGLERALERDPYNWAIAYHLAGLHYGVDMDKTKRYLEKALLNVQDYEMTKRLVERLRPVETALETKNTAAEH